MIVLIVEEEKLSIVRIKRHNIVKRVDFVDEVDLSSLSDFDDFNDLMSLISFVKVNVNEYFLCSLERNTTLFMSLFWTFSRLLVRAWDAFWVLMCFSHLKSSFIWREIRLFSFFRLRCTLFHTFSFFRKINLWSTMSLRKLSLIISYEIWEKFLCLIISTLLWCRLFFRFKKSQWTSCLIFCLLNFWLTKVSCLLFESHDFFFSYSLFVSFSLWFASILL